MLSKSVFNIIRTKVLNRVDLDAFRELLVKDQVEALVKAGDSDPLTKAISRAEYAAVVLIFALERSVIVPGSSGHFTLRAELGIPEPISTWHDENPPTTFSDLVMNWGDVRQKAMEAAEFVDFKSASNPVFLAAAIRHALGMGGLEDLMDPRAIDESNPTMALLITALRLHLVSYYPHWYPEGDLLQELPEGVNGQSRAELNAELNAIKAANRAKAAQEAREKKRKDELAFKASNRTLIRQDLERDPRFPTAIASLKELSFDGLRDYITEDGWVSKLLPGIRQSSEIEQIILLHLNRAWFRESADGDLKLRKSAPKPKSTVRRDNAIQTSLSKLIAKYGDAVVPVIRGVLDNNPLEAMKAQIDEYRKELGDAAGKGEGDEEDEETT
jgi:hypothetical protein